VSIFTPVLGEVHSFVFTVCTPRRCYGA